MIILWLVPANVDNGHYTISILVTGLLCLGAGATAFFSLRGMLHYFIACAAALLAMDVMVLGLSLVVTIEGSMGNAIVVMASGLIAASAGFAAGIFLSVRLLPKGVFTRVTSGTRLRVALPLTIISLAAVVLAFR